MVSQHAEAEVSVHATINPEQATIEDELILTVTVEGSRKSSEPVLPPMPVFKVVSSGTSSSIQIINGRMSFKKQYTYILIPQEEGAFTIASISVFAGGREYKTRPVQVVIGSVASGRGTIPVIPRGDEADLYPGTPPDQPKPKARRPYWISVDVSNKNPFVNEQILFTFRFYTSVNVGGATLTLPEFQDFWMEEVVPENKYYQNISNQRYVVSEKVMALFPLRSGTLTIEGTELTVEVPDDRARRRRSIFDDPLFNFGRGRRVTKNLRAKPIELEVQPLPQDRPDDFSNLVGQYELNVGLSNEEVKMGESTTLNIEISGKGNVKDGILPKTIDMDPFKVYDDKPVTDTVRTKGGIEGRKSFKKALVPTEVGDYPIRQFTISYFDPTDKTFKKLISPELSLKVLPSESESLNLATSTEASFDETKSVKILTEDIATIHDSFDLSPKGSRSNRALRTIILLGFIISPCFFIGTLFIQIRRSQRRDNVAFYRGRQAKKLFISHIKSLRRLKEGNGESLSKLLEAFREYIGDRCDLYGRALTAADILQQLRSRGVGHNLATKAQEFIAKLDAVCYGGGSSEKPLREWIGETKELVRELEKGIR